MNSTPSTRPVVALDADEVLFPFAASYAQWRHTQGMATFDPTALAVYDFAAALGDTAADSEHTNAFLADPATLDIEPLRGAVAAVQALAEHYRVVIVTNRYRDTQSDGTHAWVARWLRGIDDVIFARARCGDHGPGKHVLCAQLDAVWLVDDSPEHLGKLTGTRGLLFGNYPWQGPTAARRAARWDAALPMLCTPT